MKNRFHSEAKLPRKNYPLANQNKSSANREMPLFSRLYPSLGYLQKIFPPRGITPYSVHIRQVSFAERRNHIYSRHMLPRNYVLSWGVSFKRCHCICLRIKEYRSQKHLRPFWSWPQLLVLQFWDPMTICCIPCTHFRDKCDKLTPSMSQGLVLYRALGLTKQPVW